jgi:hypothetical protein
MATLTPSGISRSSSEWLLRNSQSSSRDSKGCESANRAQRQVRVHWLGLVGDVVQFGIESGQNGRGSVHVLHLDGVVGWC